MSAHYYEIRVRGRLSQHVVAEFEDLELVATVEPSQTVLRGPLEDQAALHGVLRRIEAFGLELVEVRRAPHR